MLSTTDLRGTALSVTELRAALPRAEYDVEAALEVLTPLVSSTAGGSLRG